MEAERLPDGRTRLVAPVVYGFDLLITFLGEALWELRNERDAFLAHVGLRFKEAESLKDELLLIRYGPLGVARPTLHNGELWGPTKVRRTGTSWDVLPKMEAEVLPDGRVALTLARGELAILANAVEVVLDEQAPTRSGWYADEFQSVFGLAVEEAEELMRELRRLDRKTRV